MKAAVLRTGGSIAVEEIKKPEPKENEVLVKVAACGACHTDLHVIKGEIPFPLPAVLGHEISGIVELVAPGVSELKEGDRVVSTFIIPCGKCFYCVKGFEHLCETFYQMNRLKGTLFDGTTRLYTQDGEPIWMYSMGGLAEYAVVPQTDVFPIPQQIPIIDACIMGCALFTAYGAAKNQAALRPGESVAVIAVGGIGSNLVQVAKAFGAGQIIGVDVKDDKLEAARHLGATDVVNARTEDPVSRILSLTGGRGVDVAFEASGKPETLDCAMNSVRSGGRVVVIGLPGGTNVTFPTNMNKLVRKEIRLLGSYGAKPRQDMPELIELVRRGRIDVQQTITRRYGLDAVNLAFDALQRGEVVGRSILKF